MCWTHPEGCHLLDGTELEWPAFNKYLTNTVKRNKPKPEDRTTRGPEVSEITQTPDDNITDRHPQGCNCQSPTPKEMEDWHRHHLSTCTKYKRVRLKLRQNSTHRQYCPRTMLPLPSEVPSPEADGEVGRGQQGKAVNVAIVPANKKCPNLRLGSGWVPTTRVLSPPPASPTVSQKAAAGTPTGRLTRAQPCWGKTVLHFPWACGAIWRSRNPFRLPEPRKVWGVFDPWSPWCFRENWVDLCGGIVTVGSAAYLG